MQKDVDFRLVIRDYEFTTEIMRNDGFQRVKHEFLHDQKRVDELKNLLN